MMFMLDFAGIVTTILQMFAQRLQLEKIYLGIVFAILGLASAMLARRIARVVRKTNNIEDNDKVMLTFKTIGLMLIFLALILMMIKLS